MERPPLQAPSMASRGCGKRTTAPFARNSSFQMQLKQEVPGPSDSSESGQPSSANTFLSNDRVLRLDEAAH